MNPRTRGEADSGDKVLEPWQNCEQSCEQFKSGVDGSQKLQQGRLEYMRTGEFLMMAVRKIYNGMALSHLMNAHSERRTVSQWRRSSYQRRCDELNEVEGHVFVKSHVVVCGLVKKVRLLTEPRGGL